MDMGEDGYPASGWLDAVACGTRQGQASGAACKGAESISALEPGSRDPVEVGDHSLQERDELRRFLLREAVECL